MDTRAKALRLLVLLAASCCVPFAAFAQTTPGGPAIDAFLEQNWLERFESEGTHRLFIDTIAARMPAICATSPAA